MLFTLFLELNKLIKIENGCSNSHDGGEGRRRHIATGPGRRKGDRRQACRYGGVRGG